MAVPFALRALRHRNFQLFAAGQTISLIGSWMQQLAMGWLVYRLTNSPFLLGLVAFGAQGPTFILAPIAGAVADRSNRHRMVLLAQIAMMLQACILAALVVTGTVKIWHVLALSTFYGCASAVDIPARQSFLQEMVSTRDELANAIALNSSMFNAARLIGPALAGLLIAQFGEGAAFVINALSYIAVIGALLAMRFEPRVLVVQTENLFATLRQGFRYAYTFSPIRDVLSLVAAVALFGVPFTVLMSIFAVQMLHGDARTLGWLMSATGLGALGGALFLAQRKNVRGLSKVIAFCAALFGAALIVFALSRSFATSLIALAVAGFGMMVQMAASNTFLQTVVEDDKRGRIVSLYTMAYIGVAPLGSLLAGAVAERITAPVTLAIGGGVCIVSALLFARQIPRFRELVGPIYQQLGIITEQ
ncbi:MAG TPA: MFS transporter [Longimicrobiales bacterium]|nr:MFS transporter [Longimicrobiales bacterium]